MENLLITNAISTLCLKLKTINPEALNISEYNKKYLQQYISNYNYYMNLYGQLLMKTINKLSKPVQDSVFVDYGGGCGILSFLAKEIGFKTVIYNDIYPVSVKDAATIANCINISIDHFIEGDVEQFVSGINILETTPDCICSFDVLEHIYDLESWIKTISNIKNSFAILFITSANSKNPFIKRRLKKIHYAAEYKGFAKYCGWKDSDTNISFIEERKKIIRTNFPNLPNEDLQKLAIQSRGLIKDSIIQMADDYSKKVKINYKPQHPSNTCDPYTGNWAERLIDIDDLKNIVRKNSMSVEVTNTYYGYSNNKLLDLPKRLLNTFVRMAGKNNLFFSPMYVLEITKPAR